MKRNTTVQQEPVRELSPRAFWASYALVVAIFVVVDNPLFSNPFDIDRSIIYSYLPIPFLIAGLLALERKLGLVSFLLGTVKLTTLKFGTTYFLAVVMWTARGAPARPAVARAATTAPTVGAESDPDAHAPPATPLDPSRTGTLQGTVVDAAGAPAAGALVYISKGLDDFTFDAPAQAVALSNDGHGFRPPVAVVQSFQPLALHATDGRLHTALGVDEAGHTLFNRPLISAGVEERTVFRRAAGWVRLRCSIHPGEERAGSVLVLAHPFFTRAAADGRFELAHVPFAAALEVAAVADENSSNRRIASARVAIASSAGASAVLTLPKLVDAAPGDGAAVAGAPH